MVNEENGFILKIYLQHLKRLDGIKIQTKEIFKMKIFDYNSSIFNEGAEKLDKIISELRKLSTLSTSEFDEEIFRCHERARFCDIVGATGIELSETRKAEQEAPKKKQLFTVERQNKKDELRREAAVITRPWIEYLGGCVDGSFFNIKNQIHFEFGWSERALFSDKSMVTVETNLDKINEARRILLGFRTKVRDMLHCTTQEIRTEVEGIDEKVNSLDFKKCETIPMTIQEAKQFERDLKPSPPPIPRETYEYAQKGVIADKWEDTLMKFEQAKKTFYEMLPSAKG